MEKVTYRISLDTMKNGVQRVIQGFGCGDNMSRRIEISLVCGNDTYELPLDNIVAMMYVTTPSNTEPSVNACEIIGNTIAYDVLTTDISEEGKVHLQLKLIQTSPSGAQSVLIAPRFAMEVWESYASDTGAESTTTFTALEEAVAKANAYFDSRMVSWTVDEDKNIVVTYADGTTYISTAIADALQTVSEIEAEFAKAEKYANDSQTYSVKSSEYATNSSTSATNAEASATKSAEHEANALSYSNLSKSYAVGTEGAVRTGDATDNAKYYKEFVENFAASMESGLIPLGTIPFEDLDTINPSTGFLFNISNDFISDDRFKDGGGKSYASGTNVYYTADGYWDCLAGAVPTINGKTGSSIRLDAKDLLMDGYEKAEEASDVLPEDTVATAMGKIEKKTSNISEDIASILKSLKITRGTLAAGETSITIADERITENSVIEPSTSIYGVNPISAVATIGSVTYTFAAQESDMEVGVQVYG